MSLGERVGAVVVWADAFQRRHPVVGTPYAVVKKFGEDQAGNHAALVAYYAFFGIFPLLLVLVTVLALALQGNPELQAAVVDSALAQFPVIGDQLRDNARSLPGSGVALAVGVAGALFGARGMAGAMQNAANSVWGVPFTRRPNVLFETLRSVALCVAVGAGLTGTTYLSGLLTSATDLGAATFAVGVAGSAALNVGVFWLCFRLATSGEVPTGHLLPGAVVGAVGWQALQVLGTTLVTRSLAGASNTYGAFAVVIGLLSWLALAATISLYALEYDVVRVNGLAPRGLRPDDLTAADRRALEQYADMQRRVERQTIEVRFPRGPAPGTGDGKAAGGSREGDRQVGDAAGQTADRPEPSGLPRASWVKPAAGGRRRRPRRR